MTSYWRAHEVEKIVEDLVPLHHDHLARHDVTIRCVFRDTVAKSRGRMVLGKARKVSGLAAHLVGLVRKDDLGDDPADFFVIEVPAEPWSNLTHPQREALVDHELCHFWVSIPDDPDKDRQLVVLGHDLEEFEAIVKRHGLWKPDLKSFAKVASGQLSLADLEPGEVLRHGAGVVLGVDEAECTVDIPAPVTDEDLRALTPDQLEQGIHAALEAQDVQAAYGYLMLMALKDPERADQIRRTFKDALAIIRAAKGGAS